MRQLYRFLLRIKFWQFVLLFFVVNTSLNFILGLMPFTDYSNPEAEATHSFWGLFIMGVILAPIWETLACQAVPVGVFPIIFKNWQLGNFKIRHYTWPLIVFSAFLFAVIHPYHWSYMVIAFIVGLSLAFAYHVSRKRRYGGFVAVAIIHACHNLTVLILEIIDSFIQ